MVTEKGLTCKYLREKHEVPAAVKEQLRQFTRIKKSLLDALREDELTIAQLADKLSMPRHEVVYYLMSMIKYGYIMQGEIDDMDEYYTYKRTK
jgi:predicted transcriptional regulator